jgi:hypothetical protein
VKVDERIVARQQRREMVGNPVFGVLGAHARAEVAVEVAVPLAGAQAESDGVGNRHQRQHPTRHASGAVTESGGDIAQGCRAAGFVAVHGAEHHEPRAARKRLVLVYLDRVHG